MPLYCFHGLGEKGPLKKLDPPVKTFHGFAIVLTSMVTKTGHNCDEIHIIFDTYREDCIKNAERGKKRKVKRNGYQYHQNIIFQ